MSETIPVVSLTLLPLTRRDALTSCCDFLASLAIGSADVLQLLAVPGLSDRERLLLSEYRCAAMIRQPEDLPSLSGMIHGYFATAGNNLD